MTLAEFEEHVKTKLRAFVLDYMERHNESPEQYPLSLPKSNQELWWDFFLESTNGKE